MNEERPTLYEACANLSNSFGRFSLSLAYSLKVDRMIDFVTRFIEACSGVYATLNPAYGSAVARFAFNRMEAEIFAATKDRKVAAQINYMIDEKARLIAKSGFKAHSSVLEDLRYETRRRLSVYSSDNVIIWLSGITTGDKLAESMEISIQSLMSSQYVQ